MFHENRCRVSGCIHGHSLISTHNFHFAVLICVNFSIEYLYVIPFHIYEFNEIWYNEMYNLYRGENDMFTLFATFSSDSG